MDEKKLVHLTNREQEVMEIIWKSSTKSPLLASDIVKVSSLSINTVNAALKKLLEKKLIEVADIGYSGTVLSRRYRSAVDQVDFATDQYVTQIKKMGKKVPTSKLVATFLSDVEDKHTLSEIESMLSKYKTELEGRD